MSSFDKLSAMMVDDCIHDPILGAKLLLGVKTLPPHQELRIRAMWTTRMFIDSSGYGTGKSMSLAIVAALRAMLMSDRIAGIISGSLRQGTVIHAYFDSWVARSKIFREQVLVERGTISNSHSRSAHIIKFRNGSHIRTLAPDFKGGAKLIASESWSDGYFDEWVRYPNLDAFYKVILGRTRRPILEQNGRENIFSNHICFFGTASYQWSPAYKLISEYIDYSNGTKPVPEDTERYDYGYQSWNYQDYADKYKYLLNMHVIRAMEITNPRATVEMEVMGRWVKDSAGFYSLQDILNARQEGVNILTV